MKVIAYSIKINGIEKSITDLNKLAEAVKGLPKIDVTLEGSDTQNQLKSLSEAYKRVNEAQKNISTSTKQTNKDISDTGKTYATLGREISAYKRQLEQLTVAGQGNSQEAQRLEKDIVRLSRAQQEVRNRTREAIREADAQGSAYKRLTLDLAKLRRQYKDLAAAGQENTKEGRALLKNIESLDSRVKKIDASVGQFQRNVGNYSSALKGFGTNLTRVLGLGSAVLLFGRALRDSTEIVKQFDQSTQNLASIFQKSRKEIAPLIKQAKDLGATTAFSATQVADLQLELAKLGFNQGEIQQATESIIEFSVAVGADAANAAALAGSALRAFNLDASETERVVSTMAAATVNSALDFSKLETGLSTIAPVANAFGFSIEETVALLGQLSNAGFDASTAATATRNILLNLADANGALAQRLGGSVKSFDDLIPALVQLRDEGVDLNTTLELTDKRSVAAFNTFLQGAESASELKDAITDANEELSNLANQRLDTIGGQITLLRSAWEGFVLSITDGQGAIGEFVKAIIGGITSAITQLRKFNDEVLASQAKLTDNAIASLSTQVTAVERLEKNIVPLINRYEELAQKTSLTTDEQEELLKITNQIGSAIPQTITQLDKQGAAIDISADAARRFVDIQKEQQEVLKNDALSELDAQILELSKDQDLLNKTFNEGVEGYDRIIRKGDEYKRRIDRVTRSGGSNFEVVDGDEIEELQQRFAEVNSELDRLNAVRVQIDEGAFVDLENLDFEVPDIEIDPTGAAAAQTDLLRGSLAFLKNELSELQKAYNEAGSTSERFELQPKIQDIQNQIEHIEKLQDALFAVQSLPVEITPENVDETLDQIESIKELLEIEDNKIELGIEVNQDQYDQLISNLDQLEERVNNFRNVRIIATLESEGELAPVERSNSEIVDENIRNIERLRDQQIADINEVLAFELDAEETAAARKEEIAEETARRIKEIELNAAAESIRERLRLEELTANERAALERQLSEIRVQLVDENNEEVKAKNEELQQAIKDNAIEIFSQTANAILELQANALETRLDNDLEALDTEYNRRIEAAEGNQALQSRLQDELEQKKTALEKEAAEERRKIAKKEAVVSAAQAVVTTLAQLGFTPASAIAIAALAAQTALQIAVIDKTKFEKGGRILSGKRHSQGGIPAVVRQTGEIIEVEDGEYVVPRNVVNSNEEKVYKGKPLEILQEMTFGSRRTDTETRPNVPLRFERGGRVDTFSQPPAALVEIHTQRLIREERVIERMQSKEDIETVIEQFEVKIQENQDALINKFNQMMERFTEAVKQGSSEGLTEGVINIERNRRADENSTF